MNAFWDAWTPRERATLCFIIQEGRILLIRKKRGMGAGKVNGPGGRIEPGESPLECAIRETREEVGLTPIDLARRGVLHFQFVDGYSLHCTVFSASGHEGTPIETEEALPFWVPLDSIPFEEMWADDIHWLPRMIGGEDFLGYFHFDNDAMLDHSILWQSLPA
jgi:8-oxo-dGTP diphosphatase